MIRDAASQTLTALRLLGILFVGASAACQQDVSDDAASSSAMISASEPSPVIVVMGGFNSCGTDASGRPTPEGGDRWDKSVKISARHAHGAARWVRSCFDRQSNIFFITSSEPETVQAASVADTKPFTSAITAETNGGQNPVYLHGHSHGGWLAMRTAVVLPTTVDVRVLFTVDPISPLNCTPGHYVRAVRSAAPAAISGCQEAPADITAEQREKILERVGQWSHYYQRSFLPLRSDAFAETEPQPTVSYDLTPILSIVFHGSQASSNAHVKIDELVNVWTPFDAFVGD